MLVAHQATKNNTSSNDTKTHMNESLNLHTVPYVRFWQHGQIALTAKARVNNLLQNNHQDDAKSLAEEWLVRHTETN